MKIYLFHWRKTQFQIYKRKDNVKRNEQRKRKKYQLKDTKE